MKNSFFRLFLWLRKAFIRLCVLSYKLPLRLYFKYPKWHDLALIECEYAQYIVRHLNKKQTRGQVLEIGCGMGNILRNLDFETRIGVDIDNKVLKAFSFLNYFSSANKNIKLINVGVNDLPIYKNCDAIVIVNWIHELDQETLVSYLNKLFHQYLSHGGELIFDTVSKKSYRHNHSIEAVIKSLSIEKYTVIGQFRHDRKVYSLKK